MVNTNSHESRQAAARAMLVEGLTECGGPRVIERRTCERVYGINPPSEVDGRPVIVKFTKGALVNGEPVFLCTVCEIIARGRGIETLPLDELERRVLALYEVTSVTAQSVPQAATPKAAPAPVLPVVGRVPAVRKDVQEQPIVTRPQQLAPRKEERKPEVDRGPSPRSPKGHFACLDKSRAFEEAFVLKAGGLCSCGACDTKSGKGFATKNGDYKGQRFPLCPAGVAAVIRFVSEIRREGRKPGVLVFSDENDWKRFDANLARKTQDDAIRGHAVLDGEFTERDGACTVSICKTAKPTDRIARIVDGKVVEHKICGKCAAAARKLHYQLRDEGKRWDFHLLREGEKLSEKQMQSLRQATKLLQMSGRNKRTGKGGSVTMPAPATISGTVGGKIVAKMAEVEAKKAKTAAPQPAPEPSKPAAVATPNDRADESASDPTFASVPAATSEASATASSQEETMGGGAN